MNYEVNQLKCFTKQLQLVCKMPQEAHNMSLSEHPGCLYIVWACSNHACTGRGHIVIMFDVAGQ